MAAMWPGGRPPRDLAADIIEGRIGFDAVPLGLADAVQSHIDTHCLLIGGWADMVAGGAGLQERRRLLASVPERIRPQVEAEVRRRWEAAK